MEYDINNVPIRWMNHWWSYLFSEYVSMGLYPMGIYLRRSASNVEDPRRDVRTRKTILHELIHLRQQYEWYEKAWWFGLLAWHFCYLFVLPFRYNKFRWKWEWEAYRKGQNYDEHAVEEILSRKLYGWLKPEWHR